MKTNNPIALTGINTHSQRLTLTVTEAAALLGISRNTAYAAVKRGQLPVIKLGNRLLVPRAALDSMTQAGVEREFVAPIG